MMVLMKNEELHRKAQRRRGWSGDVAWVPSAQGKAGHKRAVPVR